MRFVIDFKSKSFFLLWASFSFLFLFIVLLFFVAAFVLRNSLVEKFLGYLIVWIIGLPAFILDAISEGLRSLFFASSDVTVWAPVGFQGFFFIFLFWVFLFFCVASLFSVSLKKI